MPTSRKRSFGWGWLLSLIASFATSASLGALLYANLTLLQADEHSRQGGGQSEVLSTPSPSSSRSDWAKDFPARLDRVTEWLTRLALPMPTPTQERQGAGPLRWQHRRYDVSLPAPQSPDALEQLFAPLRTVGPDITLHITQQAAGAQVQVGVEGLLTHTLTLHWPGRKPRIAIIIDDMGDNLLIARELVALDAPLTFAVMPFRPFSKEVGELAGVFQRQVLVHLPMEADRPELSTPGMLRADDDREEIIRVVNESIGGVPNAVGVNNHMGSRFTTDRERMYWLLERLREDSLFFIDSRTTPNSVACEVAATIPLPCAARNLFLDDIDDEEAVRKQLGALVELARKHGDAIAIGHPRPATAAALQAALPDFAAAGVDLVPVSIIALDQSLAQH